jgi:signal transduction histidine kinase
MQPENTDYLVKIKQGTQDAITGIRDIIWVLDDKKDTIEHLLNRVNQFASPLCEANGIKFTELIEPSAYKHILGKEEKRNLYMILKESINNSIKYADASTIEVSIQVNNKRPRIDVKDNGKGFDTQQPREGNGLKNIATRAKEIGYKSYMISSSTEGTNILVEKS